MRILFLAPQAFFVERGTPIAIRQAVTVLAQAGHHVDLLTFHEGADISIAGVVHHRIARPIFVKNVPVGLSPAKLICDAYLAAKMVRLLRRHRYDVVHAVEESVFLALPLKHREGFKLVYDMDSIMSDQILEKWPWAKPFQPILWAFEQIAVKGADLILPVCEAIRDRIASVAGDKARTLPDVAPAECLSTNPPENLRQKLGITGAVALYVGNLEGYQGIEMLLQSLTLCKQRPHLVIIGGQPSEIVQYRSMADRLGLGADVSFLGARPLAQLEQYLKQADILCSPRTKGLNTPMKIYAYMASGRPILATDIPSHTQVLSAQSAVLRRPTAVEYASGFDALMEDADLGPRLARESQTLVRNFYSSEQFEKRLTAAYTMLEPSRS